MSEIRKSETAIKYFGKVAFWVSELDQIANKQILSMAQGLRCWVTVHSFYNAIFVAHRNGPCYKWIML